MTSNIKIYKDCEIVRNRNMFVDSITDYLNSLTNTISVSNAQYIKNGFHISVKLKFEQYQLEFIKNYNFNYMAITNLSTSAQKTCFYFITKKIWRSEEVAEFELEMDSVQTFHSVFTSQNLLTDKCKINRCHKNRYEAIPNTQQFRRKIDLYSEGFIPVLYNKFKQKYNEPLNINWFLIYRNQNEPSESLVNPVDVLIMPETDFIQTHYGMSEPITKSFSDINSILNENPHYSLYVDGRGNPQFYYTAGNHTIATLGANKVLFIQRHDASEFKLIVYNRGDIVSFEDSSTLVPVDEYSVNSGNITFYNLVGMQIMLESTTPLLNNILAASNAMSIFYTDYTYVHGINFLNRTDAKLIKIIELPYAPINVTKNDDTGSLTSYQYDNSKVSFSNTTGFWIAKLKNAGDTFKRTINFTLQFGLQQYIPLQPMANPYVENAAKSDIYESKLYHSDYYSPKYIYDSFVFNIKLELVTTSFTSSSSEADTITYVCSNTINSRFMFMFDKYNCTDLEEKDYNNVMTIARNNELPIFNQQYMNYLRAGYNFDVKNKTRTDVANYIVAGAQIVGSAASFISSIYTGGFGVAAGVSLATSAVATLTGAINTTISNETAIQQKQEQYRNQTTNVYGSDDVDLMNEYAGNRLQMRIYSVSPKMKKSLFDLFYYTGYIGEFLGNPVDYQNSRQYFNFVSADIIFKMSPNLPNDIIEDYILRYKEGITFFHRVNSTYNFAQDKENWERNLIPVVE